MSCGDFQRGYSTGKSSVLGFKSETTVETKLVETIAFVSYAERLVAA
jgi:hypothetical protein